MLELIRKREKELTCLLAKKELPAEGCSKNISDNRQRYDIWTICRYEKGD